MSIDPSRTGRLVNVRGTALLAGDTREQYRQKLARITLDSMVQFVGLLDADGTVLEINQVALAAVGIPLSDVEGKPFWTTFWWQVSEEGRTTLKEALRRASRGEFVRWDAEIYGRAGGKETIVIDASLCPVVDDRGEVVFITAEGRDITEKKAHEREIARQREELAKLDELKTQFFANISHEFRTPLTLTTGPLEDALAQPEGLSVANRERLETARRNSLRLLKLVNTLLDFSRIEAGRIQASYEPTDLAALTAELASGFRSTIERAGMRLIVDCPPLAEPVYVDREMWEKLVLNLVSNAFKFTLEGEIEVALRRVDCAAELTVRDTGTGIPAEEVPRLFERFNRVKGARGRSYEGSGIGLALVQELVRLHGGTVRVESAVDRGSRFIVSIPLGKAHLPADRIEAERTLASTSSRAEAYVEEAGRSLPEGRSTTPPAEDVRTPRSARRGGDGLPGPPRASRRVLLVDDNSDMREYVRRLLEEAGYDVQAAPDGRAALRAARARTPDLVLADVMMPGLDGFGLLRELRAEPSTRTLPVILLSARAGEESRVDGLEAGADDYLVKPFSARELLARVASQLELARVRGEAAAAVSESEQRFHMLFESMDEGFCVVEILFDAHDHPTDYRFLDVNPAFVRQTGLDDARGKRMRELEPEYEQHWLDIYGRVALTGETVRFEKQAAVLNRCYEVCAFRAGPAALRRVGIVFNDITERKRADAALAEARSRVEQQARQFDATLSAVQDYVFALDTDGRFLYANRALLDLWGLSSAESIGKSLDELGYLEETKSQVLANLRRVVESRKPVAAETAYTPPGGAAGHYEYILAPVFDAVGCVVQVAGSARDVTNRRVVEDALKDADRRKDEFLAMLAHELRNPLAAISNAVQLTKRSGSGEHQEWSRGLIEAQVRNLSRMIEDLLDVSRITRGEIPLRRQPLVLTPIIHSAVEAARPLMEERKHRLILDLGAEPLPVEGDPTRLEQILVNLLNNAAKYTESSGRITLFARREGQSAVVGVEDTGMGMSPELLARSFDLFAQGDRTIARSEGGLGIGLTLVKRLVEMHDGTVTAESEGHGKGSRFTVRLPLARHRAAHADTGDCPALVSLRTANVLVVDDNVDTARGLSRLLRLLGHDVRVAHDGPSAIEEAHAQRPEVILLDLGLPGMDGYQVARTLRDDGFDRTVIIAVSGYGEEQAQVRSRESGFDHHLIKPVDFDSLVALISKPH